MDQSTHREVTITAGTETITVLADVENFSKLVGNPRFIPEGKPSEDGETFEPTGRFEVADDAHVASETEALAAFLASND